MQGTWWVLIHQKTTCIPSCIDPSPPSRQLSIQPSGWSKLAPASRFLSRICLATALVDSALPTTVRLDLWRSITLVKSSVMLLAARSLLIAGELQTGAAKATSALMVSISRSSRPQTNSIVLLSSSTAWHGHRKEWSSTWVPIDFADRHVPLWRQRQPRTDHDDGG
jgi:hypothetical protein